MDFRIKLANVAPPAPGAPVAPGAQQPQTWWDRMKTPVMMGALGTGALSGLMSLGPDYDREPPAARRRRILMNTLLGAGVGGLGAGALMWGNKQMQDPKIQEKPPTLTDKAVDTAMVPAHFVQRHLPTAGALLGGAYGLYRGRKLAPNNLAEISKTVEPLFGRKNFDAIEQFKEQRHNALEQGRVNASRAKGLAIGDPGYYGQAKPYRSQMSLAAGGPGGTHGPAVFPGTIKGPDIGMSAMDPKNMVGMKKRLVDSYMMQYKGDRPRAMTMANEMMRSLGAPASQTIMRNPRQRADFLMRQTGFLDKGVGLAMKKLGPLGRGIGYLHGQAIRPSLRMNPKGMGLGSFFGHPLATTGYGLAGGLIANKLFGPGPQRPQPQQPA